MFSPFFYGFPKVFQPGNQGSPQKSPSPMELPPLGALAAIDLERQRQRRRQSPEAQGKSMMISVSRIS